MKVIDFKACTRRSIERKTEDRRATPVIIKRNDEGVRDPDDMLEKAICEGVKQLERRKSSLFLSSVSGGLVLGFSVISVSFAYLLVPQEFGYHLQKFAMALFYPLGFIICILSGSQLFTEHTALAVYPILDKRGSKRQLLKVWSLVLAGNLTGTFLSSCLITLSGSLTKTASGYISIAENFLSHSSFEVFIGSILAGWLMAMGSWLLLATPPTTSRILCIYIVTFIIGIGGFQHSVVGSAEVFTGILLKPSIMCLGAFKTLGITVLGNLIGGSVLVAFLNYSHIKGTQQVN
jgi:formate/nitrite transporter FocA (FNT family)